MNVKIIQIAPHSPVYREGVSGKTHSNQSLRKSSCGCRRRLQKISTSWLNESSTLTYFNQKSADSAFTKTQLFLKARFCYQIPHSIQTGGLFWAVGEQNAFSNDATVCLLWKQLYTVLKPKNSFSLFPFVKSQSCRWIVRRIQIGPNTGRRLPEYVVGIRCLPASN